jgi:transcriptional regulator with XRE-family HTH domain
MGNARRRPERLAEKLLQIRTALGLSQSDLWRRLNVEDEIPFKRVSDFELDKAEPTLMVLLQYSRVAGVHTEVLIDDDLNLPDKLPGDVQHEAIKRKYASRARGKRR